jgi:hypothetical protein
MRRWAPIALAVLSLASGVACNEKRDELRLEIDVDAGPSEQSDQTQQSERPEQTEQTEQGGAGAAASELPQCNTSSRAAVPPLQVKQIRHDLGGVETLLAGQKARFSGRIVGQRAGSLQIEGRTEYAESYYPPASSTVPAAVADAGALTERWTVMGPSEIDAVPAPVGTEVEVTVDIGPTSAYRLTPDTSIVVRSGEQVLLLYVQEEVYLDNAIGVGGFVLWKGAHTCVSVDECWYTYEDQLVVRSAGTDTTLAPGETRSLGDYRVWGRAGSSDGVPGAYSLQSCNDHFDPPLQFTAVLQPGGG